MWKPCNCSVASNEQVADLVVKAFLGVRKVDLKTTLPYITTIIAIVAFLLAVEYFTAKPSLSIGVHPMGNGYYMDALRAYYEANDIDFPEQLTEDPSLRKLFAEDARMMDPNHVHIMGGISDEEVIKAILRGQDVDSWAQYATEQLERQIGKCTFVRHIYAYTDERGFYREENFKPIRDYIKSKLSTTDYYIFLTALIRSREVDHTLFIKNDGDIDLKNVRITFPAPVSKVTNSRAGNILACRAHTTLLHEVVADKSEMTLRLPSLKKDEGLSLNIRTRENQISSEEVFYSYEQDKFINKRRVYRDFSIILVVMFVLSRVCIGSNAKSR